MSIGYSSKRDKEKCIHKSGWENSTGLNIAMVEDLIVKQNVEFAKTIFSEKVACALEKNGDIKEAEMCRLIDQWYQSEDETGISATDRCIKRLQLREWMLKDVSFFQFPPTTAYINNIPQVLFEGLLTNIERKLQLVTFTKRGCYNVRAVSSLDIENFFGSFQDIDPRGSGVLRPDDIPSAISVAVELLDAKLNPNRFVKLFFFSNWS